MATDQQRVINIVVNSKNSEAAVKQLTAEIIKLETQLLKVKPAANDSTNGLTKQSTGLASVSKNAGQAGIQVQQFVGQVQGGQNAMVAFSQQAADLGIVLGVPLAGAIVGIASSLVMILLPSLFKTKKGIIGVDEAAGSLASNLDKINAEQRAAAVAVFAQKLKEDKKELKEVNKELVDARQNLQSIRSFGKSAFGDTLEEAEKEVAKLNGSVVNLELQIKETEKTLGAVFTGSKDSIKAFNEAVKESKDIIADFKSANAVTPIIAPGAINQAAVIEQFIATKKELKALEEQSLIDEALTATQRFNIQQEFALRRVELEKATNAAISEARIKDDADFLNTQIAMEQKLYSIKSQNAQAGLNLIASTAKKGTALQKIAFIAAKGVAAATALNASRVASAAALAPPPIGLGPVAGAGLSAQILLGGKLNALAILAQGVAGLGSTGSSTSTTSETATNSTTTGSAFAPPTTTTVTERTSTNQVLNELRKWNGSQFIPIEVARGIAEALVEVERQGGLA